MASSNVESNFDFNESDLLEMESKIEEELV